MNLYPISLIAASEVQLAWLIHKCMALDYDYDQKDANAEASLMIRQNDDRLHFGLSPDLIWWILEERIHTLIKRDDEWMAECYGLEPNHPYRFCYEGKGPSARVAIVRAYITSRLGAKIEVPEGLL